MLARNNFESDRGFWQLCQDAYNVGIQGRPEVDMRLPQAPAVQKAAIGAELTWDESGPGYFLNGIPVEDFAWLTDVLIAPACCRRDSSLGLFEHRAAHFLSHEGECHFVEFPDDYRGAEIPLTALMKRKEIVLKALQTLKMQLTKRTYTVFSREEGALCMDGIQVIKDWTNPSDMEMRDVSRYLTHTTRETAQGIFTPRNRPVNFYRPTTIVSVTFHNHIHNALGAVAYFNAIAERVSLVHRTFEENSK